MKIATSTFLFLLLYACTGSEQREIELESKQVTVKKPETLKDSAFFDFLNCSAHSKTTELIWHAYYPKFEDEEVEEDPNPKKTPDSDSIFCHIQDHKQILQFIESFPSIKYHRDKIEMVTADLGYDDICFVCDRDTIVELIWDANREHIWINGHHYDINFAQLEQLLQTYKSQGFN